jgi:hypothetical protein
LIRSHGTPISNNARESKTAAAAAAI